MTDIRTFLQESIKQDAAAVASFGDSYYLPPPVYSEFVSNSKLDYARISTKYEVYCSFGEFVEAVGEVFGTLVFETDPDAASEITKEEFLEMYEFALFTNVRDWQYAVYAQKSKFISLTDLFDWVLSTR